ncbi:MAG: pyruvate kinase [Clostridia bacterium]|nr:pyruvate kinase [Clostridia bacterium]
MERKTKIICTVGPSCADKNTLKKMIEKGMNVARLNFSHGDYEYHKKNIELIKAVRKEMGVPLAILLDTKGPEIRTGILSDNEIFLEKNNDITLTTKEISGNSSIISVSYKELPSQLKEGDRVLIDDGNIELKVCGISETEIYCKVLRGGKLSNHKGVNVPNVKLDFPYLSEKDKSDILFGIENDVDFIAASFVRKKQDVIDLRNFLSENGNDDIKIISKIENAEGINNFDQILDFSDGIMIARGDMGVEVEFEKLPGLQKKFIKKCYYSGKMVITATQMLESMIENSTPTRAEISDVANAVFDGTSAIMLSGETAVGLNPVLAVKVMAKIANQAEEDAFKMGMYKNSIYEINAEDTTNAVCDAAGITAKDVNAKAIIVLTRYGQTARRMSKFRPKEMIISATPVEKTYHQLSLSWGVVPLISKYQKDTNKLFDHAVKCAVQSKLVAEGDTVVITAGIPLDTSGNTNIMKVEKISKEIVQQYLKNT